MRKRLLALALVIALGAISMTSSEARPLQDFAKSYHNFHESRYGPLFKEAPCRQHFVVRRPIGFV